MGACSLFGLESSAILSRLSVDFVVRAESFALRCVRPLFLDICCLFPCFGCVRRTCRLSRSYGCAVDPWMGNGRRATSDGAVGAEEGGVAKGRRCRAAGAHSNATAAC